MLETSAVSNCSFQHEPKPAFGVKQYCTDSENFVPWSWICLCPHRSRDSPSLQEAPKAEKAGTPSQERISPEAKDSKPEPAPKEEKPAPKKESPPPKQDSKAPPKSQVCLTHL